MRTFFESLATRTIVTEIPEGAERGDFGGVLVTRYVSGHVSQVFVPGGHRIPPKHYAGPNEKEANEY